jgi:hypothetical protein
VIRGAVLVVDETGDLKKGTHTVGVARQYTGSAGKVDNAQVAVYLAYATTGGHGVVDREPYLPQGWLDDPARLQAAGVPDRVGFATKPELARVMLERALAAGVPAGWVTADAVYGGSPALRGWLEARQLPYVLAVKATEPLPPASLSVSGPPTAAAWLAEQIPPRVLAAPERRPGCQGPPLVWVGPPAAGQHRRAHRVGAVAAGAPQPTQRGAGVLRVRRPGWPAAGRLGAGGGVPLAGGRGVPGRQGAVRPGPAPGAPLALLVSVGDPGHAGVRLPGGGRGH